MYLQTKSVLDYSTVFTLVTHLFIIHLPPLEESITRGLKVLGF